MDFEAYLADLPLVHHWTPGPTPRKGTGGFGARELRRIRGIIDRRFERPRIIETGAGNTTITFLHLGPSQVVSIAPDAGLRDRIIEYCDSHGVPTQPLDFRVARSEVELPMVSAAASEFDVAFIDGSHGWPNVFVDFCYLNSVVRKGGLIFVDDIQLHSVGELCRLLAQQPGYELEQSLAKVQVWRKETGKRFLPQHEEQPYIVERTRESRAANPGAAPMPQDATRPR